MPGKKGNDGLTDKQRLYAQARAAGMNQPDAYAAAGYGKGSKRKTHIENACRLEKVPGLAEHIARLQDIAASGALDAIEERRAALVELYQSSNNDRTRLKALDMLNRMSGDYVDRKEINANVQGLTRSDREKAMYDALNALKKAWEE